MNARALAAAILVFAHSAATAQSQVGSFAPPLTTALGGTGSTAGATVIQGSTTLPGTCTVRDVYIDTDQPTGAGLYVCTATNTWTNVTTGAGVSGGAANRFALFSSATALTYSDYLQFDSGDNTTAAMTVNVAGTTAAKPGFRIVSDTVNGVVFDVVIDGASRFRVGRGSDYTVEIGSLTLHSSNGIINSAGNLAISAGTQHSALVASSDSIFAYTVTASKIPFYVKGAAAQTANLTEWRNSSDAVQASVSAGGDGTFRHHLATGTAPSVGGSCGTSPSVAGQDSAMVITAGTVAPTSCAVTFNVAWATAPVCTANAQTTTTPLNVVTTTTTVTVSAAALTASEKLYVTCIGY